MLILSRKKSQTIRLLTSDCEIVIYVVEIRGKLVRVGIQAPQSVVVVRGEVKVKEKVA